MKLLLILLLTLSFNAAAQFVEPPFPPMGDPPDHIAVVICDCYEPGGYFGTGPIADALDETPYSDEPGDYVSTVWSPTGNWHTWHFTRSSSGLVTEAGWWFGGGRIWYGIGGSQCMGLYCVQAPNMPDENTGGY